jgi:hypothetical protein
LRSGKEGKMPAKKNERGNVPAHDKQSNGHSKNGCAERINIAKVFGRKEKSFRAKAFHETSINNTEQNEPEDQEYLVFPEVQKKHLHG